MAGGGSLPTGALIGDVPEQLFSSLVRPPNGMLCDLLGRGYGGRLVISVRSRSFINGRHVLCSWRGRFGSRGVDLCGQVLNRGVASNEEVQDGGHGDVGSRLNARGEDVGSWKV